MHVSRLQAYDSAGVSSNGQENVPGVRISMPSEIRGARAYTVSGTNPVAMAEVLQWMDAATAAVEGHVGIPVPFPEQALLVRVTAPSSNSPSWAIAENYAGGACGQALGLSESSNVLADAEEPLCYLLLARYAAATKGGLAQVKEGRESRQAAVPRWLSAGMAGNLRPRERAANSEDVHARWSRGLLPSFGVMLEQDGGTARCDTAYCGMAVAWLIARPDRQEVFSRMFARIAQNQSSGTNIFGGVFTNMPSFAEIDRSWDQWMLRQRRLVFDPGLLTPGMIDRFESELRMYPGSRGVPVSSNLTGFLRPADLVAVRNERWVPLLCADQVSRVRLAAVGRGRDLQDVAEAYARFFDAVGKRRRLSTIEDLLDKAETALADLRKRMDAGSDGR